MNEDNCNKKINKGKKEEIPAADNYRKKELNTQMKRFVKDDFLKISKQKFIDNNRYSKEKDKIK